MQPCSLVQKSVSRLTYIKIEQEKRAERERQVIRNKSYIVDSHLALDRKDESVKNNWKNLCRSIGTLVNVNGSLDGVTWDSLDETLQQKFVSYAPNAEELFEVYGMKQCMFK